MFAGNRSAGRIALSVAAAGGVTRRRQVYEDGPLRVRFPNSGARALEAMIVNTAGGIAGGDRHDLDIAVGDGATLAVTTAAAEKVYRALGPPAEIAIKLAVGAGARLSWLPQETILFDRARLDAPHRGRARAGRHAADGRGRGVRPLGDGRGGASRARSPTAGGCAATAGWCLPRPCGSTARSRGCWRSRPWPAAASPSPPCLPCRATQAMVERARAQTFCGEVGVSAWNGLAVARLCAKDGASLRRDLAAVIAALGGTLPRLWLELKGRVR